jgi:hypothetical protein
MKRLVDYTWRLAEIMAAHGMHNSTELIPGWPSAACSCPGPKCIEWFTNAPNAFRCNCSPPYATSSAAELRTS